MPASTKIVRSASSFREALTTSAPHYKRAANTSPLTARGGGTSQAGQSIGPGLQLDYSKYLNRILEISAASVGPVSSLAAFSTIST